MLRLNESTVNAPISKSTGFALPRPAITALLVLINLVTAVRMTAAQVVLSTSKIAAKALPSVVSITVRGADGQPMKTGSGFVVDWGVVATNQHVVMGAHEVTVNFADGKSVSSPGFIAERTQCDIALIACDMGNVPALPLCGTSNVVTGENVVAVGSPEGLYGSVTSGIVSGVRILTDHDDELPPIQRTRRTGCITRGVSPNHHPLSLAM